MDRRMVNASGIPQDLDINQNLQFAMVSDGMLAESIMGSAPWCYGLACAPTVPASMALVIGRGAMGGMSVVDATNPGTSAIADTVDALMKIGINLAASTLAFVAPLAPGQSQAFVIEGQPQEADTGPLVQQYYNPANPSQPFSGPNNTGASQNTVRTQRVVLQVVSGASAPTGSQALPAVTAGWSPLWVVTIPNGATALTAANFARHPACPVIPFQLPQLTPGFSRIQSFVASTTWTVPPGVTRVRVRVIGGGGGGGAGSTSISAAGGGAGGYADAVVAVAPGQIVPVIVGGQGTPSISTGVSGGAGGTSSALGLSATGGIGGGSAMNGSFTYTNGGAPGQGFGGALNFAGGYGSDGMSAINNVVAYFTGHGGASFFGGGGRGGTGFGFSGLAPGSGGGGCYGAAGFGGAGAAGLVIVEY